MTSGDAVLQGEGGLAHRYIGPAEHRPAEWGYVACRMMPGRVRLAPPGAAKCRRCWKTKKERPMRNLALLVLIVSGCSFNTNPGTGEKVGQIVRVKEEGILCKTWEAELIRGGLTDGSGTIGAAPFTFTVPDDERAVALSQHMRNRTEIIIRYRTAFIYWWCSTGSGGDYLEAVDLAPASARPSPSAPRGG